MADMVIGNPFTHFMVSEAWAGFAGVAVYTTFRIGAWVIQRITEIFPLQDKSPADFLELILSWGGAFSAAATFAIISLYQIAVLLRRLWGGFRNEH
jgi:hypothetical protein